VKQLIREHKMTSDMELDRASAQIQSELNKRSALKAATNVDGVVNPRLVDDYAQLGLHPSCHPTLIEWAIIHARKEGSALGAPTTRLLQQEECYRRICAGPAAYTGGV